MVVAIAACLLVKPTALVLFFPFFVWSPSWRFRIVAGSLLALAVMLICSIGVGIPSLVFDTLVRHIWEPPRYDGLTVGAVVHNRMASSMLLPNRWPLDDRRGYSRCCQRSSRLQQLRLERFGQPRPELRGRPGHLVHQ
jgi:hypothetical protein